jgi:hypothetical protein
VLPFRHPVVLREVSAKLGPWDQLLNQSGDFSHQGLFRSRTLRIAPAHSLRLEFVKPLVVPDPNFVVGSNAHHFEAGLELVAFHLPDLTISLEHFVQHEQGLVLPE